ncbi:MAG: endolytic transglycosylase MltG [Pseudomonadota bacterium]
MGKKTAALVGLYWMIVGGIALATIGYAVLTFVRNVPPGIAGSAVVFIKPGLSVREISRELAQVRVLQAPWKLRLLARLFGKQSLLKPGEYRMEIPSPPWKVLTMLVDGKVILHKLTIPEGFNLNEVVETVSATGLADPQEFQKQLDRKELLQRLKLPGESFEGFLFPDTYLFSKVDSSQKMIEAMVARFREVIRPEDQRKANDLGFDLVQWITLASIIEKESSVLAEHATVSSVFHNRLRKKMRLQSDPTVIYGIPNFNGNLTKKDLETPTPYNTYTQSGLPPGPISNPGASAIHAAVNPARTEYLYFVADQEGHHIFSKTYEEHVKAVNLYQLHRR